MISRAVDPRFVVAGVFWGLLFGGALLARPAGQRRSGEHNSNVANGKTGSFVRLGINGVMDSLRRGKEER